MTARKKAISGRIPEGFSYSRNELHCEGVALAQIADDIGTPTYVYSKSALVSRIRRLQGSWNASKDAPDCKIHFAVKACSNIHILRLLGQLGCGADIVSGGELFRAGVAQIGPEDVVFSGVGKSVHELTEALQANVGMFNAESLDELFLLNDLAAAMNQRPRVSLRVNPNVDAKTHPYISTGLRRNKFGLANSELKEVYKCIGKFRNLDLCGLSCHIGSQIMTKTPFVQAWTELLHTAERAPFEVTHLDLGGGLGIPYGNRHEKFMSLEEYGRLIYKLFKGMKYKLSIEPGRALVGPVGVLLSRTLISKQRGSQTFYVVDAAMNDLLRPALYGATHPAIPVRVSGKSKNVTADIVGPVCESADTFQTSAKLPRLSPGSLLAFGNTGAYGMSMASQYNSRVRAAEVLVDRGSYSVIRSRETYAELIQNEIL